MRTKKDKIDCLTGIMIKLDKIENHINKMHQGISQLKTRLVDELDPNEEICPDELLANKAVVESIEDMCLTELLDREPEGDA